MDRAGQIHGEDAVGCSVAEEMSIDLLRLESRVSVLHTSFAAKIPQIWL